MMRHFAVLALAFSAIGLVAAVPASEEKKAEEKFSAKCPVSGADAKKEQAAKYKDHEVYFCCEKCKAAFEKDSTKFVAKANHQLVETKQFVQVKCPLSGGPINKEQTVKVAGIDVAFCCDKCKGKTAEAKGDDQIAMVFGDDAFKKGFEAPKKDAEKK
jgi:YHS domain-containing protein